MIYIASPYSHPSEGVRAIRYKTALRYCTRMTREGVMTYSPIVYTHHMLSVDPDLPFEFEFWNDFNEKMIAAADSVRVLTMNGWEQSRGIASEIAFASSIMMPIDYVNPHG